VEGEGGRSFTYMIGSSMSLAVSGGITQCMKFYSINEQTPSELGPEKNLFVGSNVHITLTIPKGETIQVRDIVVLGKLSLKSTPMENSSAKGSLVADHIFVQGCLELNDVSVKCESLHQYKKV
jgi:hypothetical protein